MREWQNILNELNPLKNWQGWLGTIILIAFFVLVGTLEVYFYAG